MAVSSVATLLLASSLLFGAGVSEQLSRGDSNLRNSKPFFVSDTDHAKHHDHMEAVKVGDLEIGHPILRATLPNAPVSGGYLAIRNLGAEADRLVGGSASFAGKVEVHEMMMDGDVMKMREIAGGLEIPAGGEIVLKPGGLHLMFMKLSERLAEGEMRTVTLEFEKAGPVELQFSVKRVGAGHGSHGHSDHSN